LTECPYCGGEVEKLGGRRLRCRHCGAVWREPSFKALKFSKDAYLNGYKYCSVCEMFYRTRSIWCPVCHTELRRKPRPSLSVDKERSRRRLGIRVAFIEPEKYGVEVD
jgi:hypothetical protein